MTGRTASITIRGFTVYTYKQGEKSILYSVEATDGALSTPEGARSDDA